MDQCAFRLLSMVCHRQCQYRKAGTTSNFCLYHAKGGKKLYKDSFYSFRLGKTVDPYLTNPENGDLRVDEESEICYKYDGKSWRRLCAQCHQLARPLLCIKHSTQATQDKQTMSCMFFDALEREMSERVIHKHWDHSGSELTIPGTHIRVDGFVPHTNRVYEFLGDYHHCNPIMFKADDIHPTQKIPCGKIYQSTMERMAKIAAVGYKVFYIWESDFLAWKNSSDESLMKYIQDITTFGGTSVEDYITAKGGTSVEDDIVPDE